MWELDDVRGVMNGLRSELGNVCRCLPDDMVPRLSRARGSHRTLERIKRPKSLAYKLRRRPCTERGFREQRRRHINDVQELLVVDLIGHQHPTSYGIGVVVPEDGKRVTQRLGIQAEQRRGKWQELL